MQEQTAPGGLEVVGVMMHESEPTWGRQMLKQRAQEEELVAAPPAVRMALAQDHSAWQEGRAVHKAWRWLLHARCRCRCCVSPALGGADRLQRPGAGAERAAGDACMLLPAPRDLYML